MQDKSKPGYITWSLAVLRDLLFGGFCEGHFLLVQVSVYRRRLGSKEEALKIIKGELDSSQEQNLQLQQEIVQLVRSGLSGMVKSGLEWFTGMVLAVCIDHPKVWHVWHVWSLIGFPMN